MPAAALRYCTSPGCPELVAKGRCKAHQAAKHREYDSRRKRTEHGDYADRAWRSFRAAYLAGNPLCVDCGASGRVTLANEVHHIVSLRKGGARFEVDNVMALCRSCHSVRTRRGE